MIRDLNNLLPMAVMDMEDGDLLFVVPVAVADLNEREMLVQIRPVGAAEACPN